MHRTRIKICGITRPEDAEAAAAAGADAIGLVMHSAARRFVTTDAARSIIAALPPFVTPVLLFVDATPAHVLETTQALGVRHVQLHGGESPEDVAQLRTLSVLKTIHVSRATLADEVRRWTAAELEHSLQHVIGVVLDTATGTVPGGSGIENDWDGIESAWDDLCAWCNLILAGGLASHNVAKVVRRFGPWAVDVSSGVEESIGVKSVEKITAFCRAVREADQ